MSRKKREKRARAKSAKNAPPAVETVSETATTTLGGTVNRLGLIVAVVGFIGLFALIVFLGDPPPPPKTAASPQTDEEAARDSRSDLEKWQDAIHQEVPVSARDYSRGPEDAPVQIVEFSDFECPFCKRADASIKAVLERYPDDVRLVYKNFPLDMSCNSDMAAQLHPYACKAAVMARCAGRRDPQLFWRFHDAIFAGGDLSDEALDGLAMELGVTGDDFDACVSGTEVFDEVREDVALAAKLGVTATPTFFVNGRPASSYEPDAMGSIIDFILSEP